MTEINMIIPYREAPNLKYQIMIKFPTTISKF